MECFLRIGPNSYSNKLPAHAAASGTRKILLSLIATLQEPVILEDERGDYGHFVKYKVSCRKTLKLNCILVITSGSDTVARSYTKQPPQTQFDLLCEKHMKKPLGLGCRALLQDHDDDNKLEEKDSFEGGMPT